MKPNRPLNPKSLFRYALQALTLGILASTLVFFYTVEPETYEALRNFHWGWLLAIFPLIFLAWVCNGLRVFILSRSLGYPLTFRQSLCISLSFEFGVAATPAGVGGTIIRLGLLRRAGIPIAHGTSMLAIDVAVDTIFFIVIMPFAIAAILHQEALMPALETIHGEDVLLMLGVPVLFLAVMVWLVYSGWFLWGIRMMARWPWARRHHLPGRVRWLEWRFEKDFHKMKQGIHHLYKLRFEVLLLNFSLACVQWVCRYGVLPALLLIFGAPINPFLLMLIQGLLFTLSLLVVLPGGGGAVEVLTLVVLTGLMPPHLVGLVVLLWRFFTYHLYLMGGGLTFFYALANLRKIFPDADKVSGDELEIEENLKAQPSGRVI